MTGLTKERVRFGNRGLGADEGQLPGSVPAQVVQNAVCDVIIVQTSALDENRIFRAGSRGAGSPTSSG